MVLSQKYSVSLHIYFKIIFPSFLFLPSQLDIQPIRAFFMRLPERSTLLNLFWSGRISALSNTAHRHRHFSRSTRKYKYYCLVGRDHSVVCWKVSAFWGENVAPIIRVKGSILNLTNVSHFWSACRYKFAQ